MAWFSALTSSRRKRRTFVSLASQLAGFGDLYSRRRESVWLRVSLFAKASAHCGINNIAEVVSTSVLVQLEPRPAFQKNCCVRVVCLFRSHQIFSRRPNSQL